MSAPDTYNDVQASFGRCLRRKNFIDHFYDQLMASHPAMQSMFKRTDFGHQRKALRRGISIAISFAAGSGSAQISMDEMARVHSRAGRAPVASAYYSYWLDSLIATIRDSDPRITPALELRWREALQKTIDYFTRYDQRLSQQRAG